MRIQLSIHRIFCALSMVILMLFIGTQTELTPNRFISKGNIEIVSYFPSSLIRIEDEAFAGTSLKTIVFNNGLEHIGAYAFWNADSLDRVYIPKSVESIDIYAFSNSVAIFGEIRSYAQEWAEVNKNPFSICNIWSEVIIISDLIKNALISFFLISPIMDDKIKYILRRRQRVLISMRPQDRIELYPINYRFP